jgi:hypothetical protein
LVFWFLASKWQGLTSPLIRNIWNWFLKMRWKWLDGLHNDRLDTEVDSEQIDKNLLCLISGVLWVWATVSMQLVCYHSSTLTLKVDVSS